MKTKRIIVTRDADCTIAEVCLWPIGDMNVCYRRLNSVYFYRRGHCEAFNPRRFRAIFGFLPRKGTKRVYELREVKP